jgi:hypothetical protein
MEVDIFARAFFSDAMLAADAKARLAFGLARAIVNRTPITDTTIRRTSWTAPQMPSGKAI